MIVFACGGSKAAPASVTATDVVPPPAATSSAVATAPRTPAQALTWRRCGSFDCASLGVPLDYAHPERQQVQIALVRQPAKDAANRIGALLVNPGGPGASGVDFARHWAPSLPRELQNRFDIVGFDPRGVGESRPALLCHDDIQKIAGLEPFPKSDEQWKTIQDTSKAFADLCAQRGGELLPFLGTENVVRDLDRIREALGEAKLTYFGYSYGTVIGAVYADRFPQRVRAIVLDGAVDFSLPSDEVALEQALGFEGAYQHFIANCRAQRCLPADRGDADAAVQAVIDKSERAPIPAPSADRPAGPGETLLGILGSLYTKQFWPDLARAVDKGLSNDGSTLVHLADEYLGRGSDGSYDNSAEMNTAVNCQDYASSRDPAHYRDLTPKYAALAPHFGASIASGSITCAYWAAPPTEPLTSPHARGAPPILVIGTTGDPATPYKWAVSVSKQLESGVLLTYNGEGHTAYRGGDTCIDDAVNDYLLSLKTPGAGATCGDPARATPIDVSGAAAAVAPGAQAPTTAPAVAPATSDSATNDAAPIVGLVVVVVVVGLAGGGVVLIRRRRA